MHFAFTEEQLGLREVIASMVGDLCTPDAVREAGPTCDAEVTGLRSALGEMGVLTLAHPESAGGLGLGMLEAALALEELGYVGASGPWIRELGVDVPGWSAAADDELDRGATATAAFLCGLGRRMLDMGVAHVTTREQFGQPVGSFQAVQHHLVDARLALEFARPLVWRAAWCLDNDPAEASVAASMAKHHANRAALVCARKSLQCHGAMGYAHEYDLQLFMKRAWKLAPSFGDEHLHRRRIARLLGIDGGG